MSATDPFWSQKSRQGAHGVCAYSDGCTRLFTNRERYSAVLKLIEVTAAFYESLNVTYVVIAGTAVGAYRCKGVLPWDLDVDVFVREDDLIAQMALIPGNSDDKTTVYNIPDYPGHVLLRIGGCIPARIVDTSNGFYTDIFAAVEKADTPGKVYLPWPGVNPWCDLRPSEFACDSRAPHLGAGCQIYNRSVIWPPKPCTIAGIDTYCPNRLEKYLTDKYGTGFIESDTANRENSN